MDIELTDEHEAFRASVRGFLADQCPLADVRRLMDSEQGYAPAVWAALADQLGIQGLVVPEEHGGSGYGFVELAVALEETGRALLPAPLLGTVLAAMAIMCSADTEAAKRYLPGIASGETTAALAIADDSARWPPADDAVVCSSGGDGLVLDGHRSYVVDGLAASVIVTAAHSAAGVQLYVVDAQRTTRTALPVMDQTRRLARVEFAGTPAVGLEGSDAATLSDVLDLARLALAAEQLGAARRCLELTVDYAKTRRQFGRPIGSFQAIKHQLADVALDVENATSAVRYAAVCVAAKAPDLPTVSPLTGAHCSQTFTRAAGAMLQLHGGIGFTWEHDTHLFLKRAKSSELLLGSPTYLRELLAQRAGF